MKPAKPWFKLKATKHENLGTFGQPVMLVSVLLAV